MYVLDGTHFLFPLSLMIETILLCHFSALSSNSILRRSRSIVGIFNLCTDLSNMASCSRLNASVLSVDELLSTEAAADC